MHDTGNKSVVLCTSGERAFWVVREITKVFKLVSRAADQAWLKVEKTVPPYLRSMRSFSHLV